MQKKVHKGVMQPGSPVPMRVRSTARPALNPKTKVDVFQEAFAGIGIIQGRRVMMSAIDLVAQKQGFMFAGLCLRLNADFLDTDRMRWSATCSAWASPVTARQAGPDVHSCSR
jgi:hypothetical protein